MCNKMVKPSHYVPQCLLDRTVFEVTVLNSSKTVTLAEPSAKKKDCFKFSPEVTVTMCGSGKLLSTQETKSMGPWQISHAIAKKYKTVVGPSVAVQHSLKTAFES